MAQLAPRMARLRLRTRRRKPKPPIYWFAALCVCWGLFEVLRHGQKFVITLNPFFAIFTVVYVLLTTMLRILMRLTDPEDDFPFERSLILIPALLIATIVLSVLGMLVYVVEVMLG